MSSTSSIEKPELEPGTVVAGWTIIKKLGSGGFGAVYKVEKDSILAALKTEYDQQDRGQSLRNEVEQLRVLQWSPHFCRLYYACKSEINEKKMNIMVMTLLGSPLSRLRRMIPTHHFSKSTAALLSRQSLKAIHDIHMTGILHRDIKGSNFAWDSDLRRVFLLDLGFCRRYLILENGVMKHRTAREYAGFLGTTKYCSVNVHEEMDQGRRDDLWAWLYMTAEFFLGKLPWSEDDHTRQIGHKKRDIGVSLFMQCPREFLPIYDHVKSLKFDSRPDYDFMFDKFDQMFKRLDILETDPYDFEQGGKFYEKFFKNMKNESEEEYSSRTDGEETKASRVVDMDDASDLEFEESVQKSSGRKKY